jgi:glycosyltransferase involved in cell wall biosynthesis
MKILLTITSSPWSRFKGGGQFATHRLALALHRAGHEVHVLYSKLSGDCIQSDVPYRLHWTRGFDVATLNLDIFSFAYAINRLTRRHCFDIIHGNAEESFFTPCIARRYGIPFVFTSHANIIPATGMLRGLLSPLVFLKRVNNYLLRSALSRACQIITFSAFSKALVESALSDSKHQSILVVPPGINETWFDVERHPQENMSLLFWGRLEHQKGIDDLLLAMQIAQNHFPIRKLHLTLIGEGNLRETYKHQASELGITQQVTLCNWLSESEIQKLAASATLGVFPSRIESFGLSMAEAMAAGLPIIATKVGALPEFIEDGVTGTLVPSGDVPALAKAIANALDQPEHRESMARAGREAVRQQFSWDKAAEKMLKHYDDLLGKIL